MKITKTKEVITEEIEISSGTYYFEDENLFTHKITIDDFDEYGDADYKIETLSNFSNRYGIRVSEAYVADSNDFPYEFKKFILGEAGKKIEKEYFHRQKKEIIERL